MNSIINKDRMIKVNYLKEWGNDGTVYTQTITIDKKTATEFNKFIKEVKKEIAKKFIYDSADMKVLSYVNELKEGKNFTHLTELDYFKAFIIKNVYMPLVYKYGIKKDKNIERILINRNTIIKVI